MAARGPRCSGASTQMCARLLQRKVRSALAAFSYSRLQSAAGREQGTETQRSSGRSSTTSIGVLRLSRGAVLWAFGSNKLEANSCSMFKQFNVHADGIFTDKPRPTNQHPCCD